MPLAVGERVGPYEILGPLGSGGMGAVYRALDRRLGRDVAVKVIATEGAPSPERLRRFEGEARAVAALSHPNVLTVFDVGERQGEPYVVFELLEGETLRERLRFGALPLRFAVELGVQVCRGLQAAHARGILHRDLKPGNVFLTSDGFVKILDFGLAKLVRGEGGEAGTERTQTAAGVVVGTPAYLSPEQARGLEADARSDIFALGAILYEALSGKRAFAGATAADTISAILHEDPPPVQTRSGPLPGPVERIVRRCLAKEREDRFHSAHDLALALEAALERPLGTGVEETEARGPYPGLSSFTEADAGRFFGREGEVEALWERIRQKRLLAVIGPSGAGKTSFVRAGVVASRPAGWGAVVTTPGNAPLLMLGQALAPELQGDVEALRQLVRFEDPGVVFEVLARWRKGHAQALLVVDQFEELFTLCPPETQASFAGLLGRLAGEAGLHVLVSMRDDFLMRCHEHEALGPVFGELTPLGRLSGEALRRALEEPAKAEGFGFEEGLVGEMTGAVEGERGALPLLAFAVARLWEKRDRERKLLTRAAYGEIGGVAGALAQHAEETLERIGGERQGMVREVFRNLVTSQGTRAACEREELLSVFPDQQAAEEVVGQLVAARLLTSWELPRPEGSDGAAVAPGRHRIEIVHESLLRSWLRLVRWQAQDQEGALLRDQLRQAAHLWEEKGRTSDLLWTGTSFQEFELWRGRYTGALTAVEEDFARAMREKARRRRRLVTAAVASVIVALAGVAIAIGVSRQQAVSAQRRGEASRLLTLAQLRIKDDPTEALAFTTASLELADSQEARVFAMKVLWEAPPAFDLSPDASVYVEVPVFSPDGRYLAAAGRSEAAVLWSADGKEVARLPGHVASPRMTNLVAWASPSRLVTGGAPRLHLWSVPEARELRTIDVGAEPLSWELDSDRLLATTIDLKDAAGHDVADLRSWELPDGPEQSLGRIDRTALGAADWMFAPSGRGLIYAKGNALVFRPSPVADGTRDRVVGRHDTDILRLNHLGRHDPKRIWSLDKAGGIRIWSVSEDGLELQKELRRPEAAPPESVWLELDGRLAHDEAAGKQLRVWDTAALPGAQPLMLRRSGPWYAPRVEVHPAGDWAVASMEGWTRLTFWPLHQPRATVVPGYAGLRRPVAFSPDGRWLATSWTDGKVRLWPLPGTGTRQPRILELPDAPLWTNFAFDPRGRYLFVVGLSDRAVVAPLDGSPARRLPSWSEETLLDAVGVSPSGRLVATAFEFGKGEKTLRVHDVEKGTTRVFPLPTRLSGHPPGGTSAAMGNEDGVGALAFADETTLYSAGDGGVLRWTLPAGSHEHVWATPPGVWLFAIRLGLDGHTALVDFRFGSLDCGSARILDLGTGRVEPIPAFGDCPMCVARTADVAAVGSRDGTIRVGRLDGSPPHLLVGHEGQVTNVAVSPDLRWVASTGEDDTLRLWPMPDLSKPPLSALPRAQLIAKLHSLTNLRAVRAPAESIGWKIETGPFAGWKDVPTW
jgi:WD40 repeat protein